MKMAVGPECACANGRRRKPDGRDPRVRGKGPIDVTPFVAGAALSSCPAFPDAESALTKAGRLRISQWDIPGVEKLE
jgi:hypothetical protein